MLDLKAIREDPEPIRSGLARRAPALVATLDRVIELDQERRRLTQQVDDLRSEQNRGSKAVGGADAKDRPRLIEEVQQVSKRLAELEPELSRTEEELKAALDRLPNPPHESVPNGASDEDNELVRSVGEPPSFTFEARDHADLGVALGILDLERAARVSGARFAYLMGGAVMLQWALVGTASTGSSKRGLSP